MRYQSWSVGECRDGARLAMERRGVAPLCALTLCARGLDTAEKAEEFLRTDRALLHDPFKLRDMDKAAARLGLALERGETVAVYGDYDVDGITATVLLTDYLRARGGRVIPYIPDRLEEGYGLNREAVTALKDRGAALIVTVDCGITAVEETAWAAQLGVDVIITDHHECKEELPGALAVVDPRRPDCSYPFPCLAGVGVALKLALALERGEERERVFERYCDLAAIGTVADVMSMTGENRAIVHAGLERVRSAPRPGLRALLREAGLEERPLTASSIGYTLAPRINASGRMGCTDLARELLLTRDAGRASELAGQLCALNRERQEIEGEIFAQCTALTEAMDEGERTVLVLAGENWHQGVVGIVASRLSERYACPTFMICLQNGRGKGSCRSWGGFNLFAALEQCRDLLEGFGGHALAAGFTILEENIPAFRTRMTRLVGQATGGKSLPAVLRADALVDEPEILTLEGVAALDALEPYGTDNPRPVFVLAGCSVVSVCAVGAGRHLKLKLSVRGKSFDAIFFSATARELELSPGQRVDVAFTPQINDFRGQRSVQLQLCDLRQAALTRLRSEEALYEKYRSGVPLTAWEARELLPSRAEFVGLWRYLRARAGRQGLEETAPRLSRDVARSWGGQEAFQRTMICLEVFHERGLIRLERAADRLRISLNETEGKVDLEASSILSALRRMTGPAPAP